MRKMLPVIIVTLLVTALLSGAVYAAQAKYKGFPIVNLVLNGKAVMPSSPAISIDGTTYVPLRFISESMGIKVGWNQKTQTVIIGNSGGSIAQTPAAGKNEYAVNDANGNTLYTFKINRVTTMSERNQFSDKNPAQVIMIDYTYTNIASDKDVYLSDMYFKVIDSAGQVGYTYPNSPQNDPQSIPKGVTCNAQMIFGLDHESKTVKIYFYKDLFNQQATTTFELPIE